MPPVHSCALYALAIALAAGAPAGTARPVYAYVITPKLAPSTGADSPVIRRVEPNKQHFSVHDEIQMRVLTTTNVVKVTNHELGHGGTLRRLSPGVFSGEGRVAGVPFFLKGMHVNMHFTATTESGTKVTATAPVTF